MIPALQLYGTRSVAEFPIRMSASSSTMPVTSSARAFAQKSIRCWYDECQTLTTAGNSFGAQILPERGENLN